LKQHATVYACVYASMTANTKTLSKQIPTLPNIVVMLVVKGEGS